MAAPSTALATLRPDLSGTFAEASTDGVLRWLVAPRVLPILEVPSPAGIFGVRELEDILKQRNTKRANRSAYPRGDQQFTSIAYETMDHGMEYPIDHREEAQYAEFFDADLEAARQSRFDVLMGLERDVAAAVFNATTWTGAALTTAISTEWSTVASAVPITDIANAKEKVILSGGVEPNKLVVNGKNFDNLRRNSQIIAAIEASGAGSAARIKDITASMIAEVLNLDEVIVAGGLTNAATEGATFAISRIWSNEYAMLYADYSTPGQPSHQDLTIGHIVHWGADGSTPGTTIEQYYEPQVRGDVVRARMDYGVLIKRPQLGHLLSNIHA